MTADEFEAAVDLLSDGDSEKLRMVQEWARKQTDDDLRWALSLDDAPRRCESDRYKVRVRFHGDLEPYDPELEHERRTK